MSLKGSFVLKESICVSAKDALSYGIKVNFLNNVSEKNSLLKF
jgi:hypothetical protein